MYKIYAYTFTYVCTLCILKNNEYYTITPYSFFKLVMESHGFMEMLPQPLLYPRVRLGLEPNLLEE